VQIRCVVAACLFTWLEIVATMLKRMTRLVSGARQLDPGRFLHGEPQAPQSLAAHLDNQVPDESPRATSCTSEDDPVSYWCVCRRFCRPYNLCCSHFTYQENRNPEKQSRSACSQTLHPRQRSGARTSLLPVRGCGNRNLRPVHTGFNPCH